MSGQIFISYRREESRWSARSLRDRLCRDFGPKQIFMDIDAIALGEDFVEAIETTVAECDVLIAVIGNNWLTSKDGHGNRRLDNPEDFVRMEIGAALKRKIRVIPVLVDGALMPQSTDLPEDLRPLVRRNALLITDTSFDGDCQRLAAAIKLVLEKAAAEQRQREEKERLEAEKRQREKKERLKKTTSPTHARDFPTSPWIRKIDQLSWIPFAAVVVTLLWLSGFWYDHIYYYEYRYRLALFLWLLLPSLVIISSFLTYPKQRILEVIASLLFISIAAYVQFSTHAELSRSFAFWLSAVLNPESQGAPQNQTGGGSPTLLILAVLAAITKIGLLINRRRNQTESIAKPT